MAAPTKKFWDDVTEGELVPQVRMQVPYAKVILNAAATNDYFPGHHDPEYARAQGQRNIYLNTMAIEGFIDRVATSWAGPHAFLRKRQMQMRASIYAEDTMYGEGTVLRRYQEGGRNLVDLDIKIATDEGVRVPAVVTLELPRR
jgi:acyl dehydratase